jgi:hypothetical protein
VLVESGLALTLGGRGTNLPLIYTLSGKGRSLAASVIGQQTMRFRPKEAREAQANLYFMHHLLAVNDVLIGARLLAKTHPDIVLTRLYREPELQRRIYDGSCQFLITERKHDTPQTWEQFFHIEVYRTLPPVKERYKQKIQGYVRYDDTGQRLSLPKLSR